MSSGVLRSAPDAIVVTEAGQIALMNDCAERLFGCSGSELIGQPAESLLIDSARAGYLQQLRHLTADPSAEPVDNIAMIAVRRDGSQFPAELAMSAVSVAHGRLVVIVVRDATARLRAESQRQRQAALLYRAQRLAGLEQFAGVIAHDFNNILGVIVNYAGFVAEETEASAPDLTAIAADAEQITRAGDRGSELTRQLLSYARREVAQPQALDLDAVIAAAEQNLRRCLGDRIGLTFRAAAADLPAVIADRAQMEELLLILAHNASEAMPQGGELTIETSVRHGAAAEEAVEPYPGRYVCLRVSDTGGGMSPEVLQRAFEPLFTTKTNRGGAGFGLAIAYGIVARSGGSISLSSPPERGSTVTVLLPAADHAAGERPNAAPVSAGVRGSSPGGG